MTAEYTGTGRARSKTIEQWSAYLKELHERIAHRFLRPEVRTRAYRYLAGLLGDVGRKNSWQMAEAIGEARPRGVQHLLNDARWDPEAVRDDLREYVVEHLGDEKSGVLIVDETGFLKKGQKSVGVARQYTGTAGKRENCQVGVFVCYASAKGAAFIDRALYLPREWTDDPQRLSEAGVPEGVGFATKGELAKWMLHRAFEANVPARWIVADTVYGMSRGLRGWLEKKERSYVLAVTSSKGIYHEGRQRQARKVAQSLPEESWVRASAGKGSKGERLYDWACVTLPEPEAQGEGVRAGRWLLMRRSIAQPEEIAYYLCYGPAQTNVHELIRIAGRRWIIEDCFEAAKGEVGLDEYEVRKWDGWQRHITLCLLAHTYLVVVRSVAEHEEQAAKKGISARVPIPS
ncbi:MAG: IS701 family transposase [Actinobacteria bacterium]|nr:IS701 family transposase [Actinomycetota bacterium]